MAKNGVRAVSLAPFGRTNLPCQHACHGTGLYQNEWSRDRIETGLLIKKLLIEYLLEEDMKYRDFLGPRIFDLWICKRSMSHEFPVRWDFLA